MPVEAGMRFRTQGVIIEILEVIPYETPYGGKSFLIAYRIHDHGRVTPTAHFWLRDYEARGEKLKDKLAEIASFYNEVKKKVKIT